MGDAPATNQNFQDAINFGARKDPTTEGAPSLGINKQQQNRTNIPVSSSSQAYAVKYGSGSQGSYFKSQYDDTTRRLTTPERMALRAKKRAQARGERLDARLKRKKDIWDYKTKANQEAQWNGKPHPYPSHYKNLYPDEETYVSNETARARNLHYMRTGYWQDSWGKQPDKQRYPTQKELDDQRILEDAGQPTDITQPGQDPPVTPPVIPGGPTAPTVMPEGGQQGQVNEAIDGAVGQQEGVDPRGPHWIDGVRTQPALPEGAQGIPLPDYGGPGPWMGSGDQGPDWDLPWWMKVGALGAGGVMGYAGIKASEGSRPIMNPRTGKPWRGRGGREGIGNVGRTVGKLGSQAVEGIKMVPGGIKATRGTAGAVQRGFDAAVGAVEASPWSGVPQQTAAAQQRINQPGTIDRVLGPPDTMTQSGVDRTAKGVATGKAGQQINQFWNDFGELTRNLTTQEIIEGDFYKAGKSAPAMRDAWSRMSPEMKASVTQGHKKLLAAVDASLDQDWVEKWNKTSKQGQGQKQLPPAKMQPTDAAMTAAEAKYPMPTRDVTARDIKGNKRLLDKIRGGFQTDIQFAEGFDPAAVEARAAADAEYRQSTRSPKGSLTPTAEEVFEMQMGAESSRRAEKAKGHSKSHAAKNNMTIAQSKAVMNQTLTKLNNFGRIPTNVNPSTVPAITGAAFAIGISVAELINTYGNDEGGSWTWRDPRNAVLTTEGWGIPNKETGQGYAWGAVGETAVTAAGLSQATPDMFDEVGSGAFWTGMPRGIGQSGKEMYEHITGSVGGAGRKIANWMVDDPSLAAPDDEYMRRLKQERLDRILNQVPG